MNENKIKKYNKNIEFFKDKYLNNPEIILVGFNPFCKNKKCLDLKNVFTINSRGELITCYWKKNRGKVVSKY